MADPNESGKGGIDEITKVVEAAKEEVKKEIEAANNSSNPDQEKRRLGEKIREELERTKLAAQEAVSDEAEARIRGRLPYKKEEGKKVLAALTKAVEAVRQGIDPSYIAKTKEGAAVLQKIAQERIDFTPSTASAIEYYFGDYLFGDKSLIDPSSGKISEEVVKKFSELKQVNQIAAEKIAQAIENAATEMGISKDEVREKLNMKKDEAHSIFPELEQIPPELKNNLPLDKPEIKEIVEALLTPENFVKYVKKHREKMIQEKKNSLGRDLNSSELLKVDEELSYHIEESIVDLVAELYNKADADPSYVRIPFHEVENIGYFQSLQTAYNTLSTRIQLIGRTLSERDDLKDIHFFSGFSSYKEGTRKVGDNEINYSVIDPIRRARSISLPDFFRIINLEISHFRELREFTHNARIVFRFPTGGQESAWAQLSSYANKLMTSSDFDHISFLPHSEVYHDALQIYTGLLQEELAKNDWILEPKLFAPDDKDGLNKVERDTLRILEERYKGEKNSYQIRSAFSLAQGVAMAILLTEPETIANADPNLKHKIGPDGKPVIDPTYLGEWLSDTVVTGVLNPFVRGHLRWMSESTVGGPLGYLPIPDPKLVKKWRMGIWDHNEAMKSIEKFQRRFFEGKKSGLPEGYLTLFDIRNPGRVGSHATRGGWRWEESYQGLLYNYDGPEIKEADILTKWRRLEAVGFEPWLHFSGIIKSQFADLIKKNPTFFEYVYNRYFNGIYDKNQLEERIKNNPQEVVEEIAVRFLIQRLPAKIITEERTRFSSDQKRLWEILRTRCGFSFQQMDQAVKDLILAQTNLRREMSKKMRENEKLGKDIGFLEGDFFLSEATLEKYLNESQMAEIDELTKQQRIANLKNLLKEFNSYFNPFGDGKGRYFEWIKKIRGGRSAIPFALASEEVDYRYLTLRTTGMTTIKRVLGDTARVDQVLTPVYGKLLSILKATAISGKKDISELVKLITEVKKTFEGVHGKEYANEIACYMAYLAVAYFKRDTFAKPLNGLAGIGQITSLAAEFAGGAGRVWEWDSRDIGRFIFSLEQSGALEKQPYDLSKIPQYEGIKIFGKQLPIEINLSKWLGEKLGRKDDKGEVIPIKFFGREIKIRLPKVRKKDFNIYSETLKRMAGGEFIHKLWDAVNTVIPIALAILLIFLIQKAIKEEFGQKK